MLNKIIVLPILILSIYINGMEDTSLHCLELPKELWTKIAACAHSTEKELLRQTCQDLRSISSINNYELYNHSPLFLSTDQKNYAILLTAYHKQYNAINNLLKSGANPNTKNLLNLSALDIAQYNHSNIKITNLLQQHGASHKTTPTYMIAAYFGDIHYLEQCTKETNTDWLYTINDNNALLIAANNGQVKAVELLITDQMTAPLFSKSIDYILQLSKKYLHIAELLIPYIKADINAGLPLTNHLYVSAENGNTNFVQVLLKHPDIDVNYCYRNKFTPLFIAAQRGHLDIVKLLANHPNCILDGLDPEGATPLYIACQEGHNKIVKFLLAQKASIYKIFKEEFTPLYIAAYKGHTPIIKTLLSYNREQIDQPDNEGATPLYVAAQNGHADVIKILYHYGANSNSRYLNEYTPLYTATNNGHHNVMKLLLKHSPELVNMCTLQQNPPLHYSVLNSNIVAAEILLNIPNVDPNIINNDGKTPLDIAYNQDNKNEKLIELLIQHGAKIAAELKQDQFLVT